MSQIRETLARMLVHREGEVAGGVEALEVGDGVSLEGDHHI